MDFSTPISTVIPSLDGPVLQVLARADRALTGRQVHAGAGTGSVAGIRLVLQRLASTGLVHVDEAGNSLLYRLNRKHLAAPAIELLSDLRATFAATLSADLATWRIPPTHASLYGAAARGEGDLTSDASLLLVRPDEVAPDNLLWEEQVSRLMTSIVDLTGNPVDVCEVNLNDLAVHLFTRDPILDEWCNAPVPLRGTSLTNLLARLIPSDRRSLDEAAELLRLA